MQYPSRDQADALNARGMSRAAVAAQAGLPRLAMPRDFHKRLQWDAAITCEKGLLVRSRGLEPPRVAPLAPQASASTNSATTAEGMNASRRPRVEGARCNKSTPGEQGPRPVRRSWWRAVWGPISADCWVGSRTFPDNAPCARAACERLASADTVVPRALRDDCKSSGYNHVVVGARDDVRLGLDPAPGSAPVEWRISSELVAYEAALALMEARTTAIAAGSAPELVWLLEHPPLYTAGTSAKPGQLIEARFPVYPAGRGGQFTYHGPGQRVAYVMLDLRRRGPDVRRFVATLEEWIIRTLAALDVTGERREDRIGVWVPRPDKGGGREDKIAAIGVRIKRWVTLHGIALNVDCDLSHYAGIVPCGVSEPRYGVTSLADLGIATTLAEIDALLQREFEGLFGPLARSHAAAERLVSSLPAI